MQNKKFAVVITFFAVTLFFIVAVFALYEPVKDQFIQNNKPVTEEVTGDLPELVCDYSDDKEAYKDALTSKIIGQCECVDDSDLRNVCKRASMDIIFYDRALTQLDLELCKKINSDIQKGACEQVVASAIIQFERQDPQYLADMYAATHNEKAIEQLEKLTTENQENINNYISLALAYAEKGLKEQEQGRDQSPYVNKAFEAIENAKAIDNKNSEVYRTEAYVNEIKPDYDAAFELYTRSIELDGNNMIAYAGRGHVERIRGFLEGAIADFEKAAELDVDRTNIFIYTNLCNLEYSRSNDEDAIRNCKIVIAQENVDPVFQSEANQILAMLFIKNEDYVQAKSTLLTAKTLTPNDPNLYVTFSKLDIYEGNYINAESQARKAIDLSPTKASSRLMLSHALYMQEKFNDAIIAAEQGLNLVAEDVSLLAPSKPAVEKDLNYIIAHSYRHLGNTLKQAEYEKKAEEALKNNILN